MVFGGFVSVLFALPIGNKNSLYDKGKLDDIVKAYSLSGGVMSFLLYLLSNSSDASKFFFLPYRYWEFAFGAYVGAPDKPRGAEFMALTQKLLIIGTFDH